MGQLRRSQEWGVSSDGRSAERAGRRRLPGGKRVKTETETPGEDQGTVS